MQSLRSRLRSSHAFGVSQVLHSSFGVNLQCFKGIKFVIVWRTYLPCVQNINYLDQLIEVLGTTLAQMHRDRHIKKYI